MSEGQTSAVRRGQCGTRGEQDSADAHDMGTVTDGSEV